MTWVFLDLTSPVLFRDGRSYDATNIGSSTAHPMPQAVFGALRARVGRALGFDWDFARATPSVTELVGTPERPGAIRISGPFYARARETAEELVVEPLFARPADLVAFPDPDPWRTDRRGEHPLRPGAVPDTAVSLPAGMSTPLLPLRHRPAPSGRKPLELDEVPSYLTPDEMRYWLLHASSTPEIRGRNVPEVPDPERDVRVHIAISPQGTAKDQMIFSAERIAMPVEPPDARGAFGDARYGYVLGVEGAGDAAALLEGSWRIGGKGGAVIAHTARLGEATTSWLPGVLDALGGRTGFRWVLTTPGLFAHGFRPDFVQPDGTAVFPGTTVRVALVAATVGRPIGYSGWDLQHPGRESGLGRATGAPRPTRLFVPAGSVYFFRAETPADARAVVEACWGKSLFTEPELVDRTVAIDAACSLCAGLFGPWDLYQEP
jgi:CRISPR-associated protein Cmr3